MYKLICVRFQLFAAVIFRPVCTAKCAFAVLPSVIYAAKKYVALFAIKLRDGKFAVWKFAAIHSAAGKQCRQLRYGYSEKLPMEDMVHARLQIGNFLLQPLNKALGYFTQKNARLARRIQKRGIGVGKKLLREHIQHGVHYVRRREHFVVRKVRQTSEHIGVISFFKQSHFLPPFYNALRIFAKSALPRRSNRK